MPTVLSLTEAAGGHRGKVTEKINCKQKNAEFPTFESHYQHIYKMTRLYGFHFTF